MNRVVLSGAHWFLACVVSIMIGTPTIIQGATATMPKKPFPDLLIKVLRELGTSPRDAVYVGDSETDVQTARAAGTAVVLVSYGYSDEPVATLGADRVVSSLAELDEIFTTDPLPFLIISAMAYLQHQSRPQRFV